MEIYKQVTLMVIDIWVDYKKNNSILETDI